MKRFIILFLFLALNQSILGQTISTFDSQPCGCLDSASCPEDDDPCTLAVVNTFTCECEYIFQDNDLDGVCDAVDTDDDDPCITGIPSIDDFNDSDGDGVCDLIDCEPENALIGGEGSPCNDFNASTINDAYNAYCECVGELTNPDSPCGLNDMDGDGVCDNDDNCILDANSDQMDSDGDGIGDVCDVVDDSEDLCDSYIVTFDPPNVILCEEEGQIVVQVLTNSDDATFIWEDGTTNDTNIFSEGGTYMVTISYPPSNEDPENPIPGCEKVEEYYVSESGNNESLQNTLLSNGYLKILGSYNPYVGLKNENESSQRSSSNIVYTGETDGSTFTYVDGDTEFVVNDLVDFVDNIISNDSSEPNLAEEFHVTEAASLCLEGPSLEEFLDMSFSGTNLSILLAEDGMYVKVNTAGINVPAHIIRMQEFLNYSSTQEYSQDAIFGLYDAIETELPKSNFLSVHNTSSLFSEFKTSEYSDKDAFNGTIDTYYWLDCADFNFENKTVIPESCWCKDVWSEEAYLHALQGGAINQLWEDLKGIVDLAKIARAFMCSYVDDLNAIPPFILDDHWCKDAKKTRDDTKKILAAISEYLDKPTSEISEDIDGYVGPWLDYYGLESDYARKEYLANCNYTLNDGIRKKIYYLNYNGYYDVNTYYPDIPPAPPFIIPTPLPECIVLDDNDNSEKKLSYQKGKQIVRQLTNLSILLPALKLGKLKKVKEGIGEAAQTLRQKLDKIASDANLTSTQRDILKMDFDELPEIINRFVDNLAMVKAWKKFLDDGMPPAFRRNVTNLKQRSLIDEHAGSIANASNARKGNFGEIGADLDLNANSYESLLARIDDIDAPGHNGIDGVFQKNGEYFIVEGKYTGSASLNPANPSTGLPRQMSDAWIQQKLPDAVGQNLADDIIDAGYSRILAKVAPDGTVTYKYVSDTGYLTQGGGPLGDWTP